MHRHIFHRRDFHRHVAQLALTTGASVGLADQLWGAQAEGDPLMIIDTHQHLWDLSRQKVPWLENAGPVLRRSYVTKDYLAATRGLNIAKAVYMEVDVAPQDHLAEVELVTQLCRSREHPTVAAVVGGRPASETFSTYARRLANNPYVKGVRQVLHGATPRGHCLTTPFVRSMQLLGELDLSFDLCMRAGELADGVRLVRQCPDTRFIIDHCGNADPAAFAPAAARPSHDANAWRRDMEALGQQPHTVCKISGIVARAPQGDWSPDDLAPIVDHCLDAFGPERVVFGSDWPVCRVGAELSQWVAALHQIIADRPVGERRKLLSENAQRIYRLSDS